MIKIIGGILTSMVLILSSMLAVVTQEKASSTFGSVTVGNEYFSTTTSAASVLPIINNLTGNTAPRQGTFGSIILTGSVAGGNIDFFDATTTNVNLRTGQNATSTLILASIPTGAPAGTYTYDSIYKHGILMVTSGVNNSTTTVTWR